MFEGDGESTTGTIGSNGTAGTYGTGNGTVGHVDPDFASSLKPVKTEGVTRVVQRGMSSIDDDYDEDTDD